MTVTSGSSFSFSVLKLRMRRKSNLLQKIPFFISFLSQAPCTISKLLFYVFVGSDWIQFEAEKIDFFFFVRPILPIHTAPPIMRFSELWVFPFFHPSPPTSSSSSQCFVYFLLFSNRRDVFSLSLCTVTQSHLKTRKRLKNCCYICGIVDWSFWLVNAFVFHSKWTRLYVPTRNFSAWFFFFLYVLMNFHHKRKF